MYIIYFRDPRGVARPLAALIRVDVVQKRHRWRLQRRCTAE